MFKYKFDGMSLHKIYLFNESTGSTGPIVDMDPQVYRSEPPVFLNYF